MSQTRTRPERRGARLLTDLVVVFVGLAVAVGVRVVLDVGDPTDDVMWLMALVAVAVGSAAALLGVLLAWLLADQRVGWLSVALACYCLIAVPATALGARNVLPAAVADGITVVAEGSVAALLLLAVTVPPRLYRWRARGAALAALGVVVTGGLLAAIAPGVAVAAATTPLRLAVALTWTGLAVTVAVRAARRRVWGLWRIGAGFALLGLVRVARVGFPDLALDAGLILANLRLLGVALVFWGVVGLAWRALTDLGSTSAAQEEELRLAEVRLARAAERDHELRSGLAGLAGVTTMFSRDRPDAAGLSTVVASELTRLDDLLRRPFPPVSAGSAYDVAPVLGGLAVLRRSAGIEMYVDAPPGLYAVGSSRTLAQVVTNLLGNAARHAPGSPVWVRAHRRGKHVLIEVRDAGPGVTPGREEAVFDTGERDPAAGGAGLGLAVARRLLAAENATIVVHPADPRRPGCVVVIELPACPITLQGPVPVPPDSAERTTT